jgi:nucleoside-diphosphate-sugar epimerase
MGAVTRLLVFGGGGFIGSHLVRSLIDDGGDVEVVDGWCRYGAADSAERARTLAWRREHLLAGAALSTLHTDDGRAVRRLLGRHRPEVVVHLANLPLAGRAQADPAGAGRAIVGATQAVLGAIHDSHRPKRLVYVSSSMVYGDFVVEPMPESREPAPRETYGRLKLAAERAVREAAGRDGFEATIVRPSAVYGAGDLGGRFIQRLVEAARTGATFRLGGPAEARLDFTNVLDLACGLRLACTREAAAGGTFNVTSGRARSLGEAIGIVRSLGHELDVVAATDEATVRPRRGTLDISLAAERLGYRPRHTLESGLEGYLDISELVRAGSG